MINKHITKTVGSMQYGDIYDEFNEDMEMLDNAYQAFDKFCQKQVRRQKTYKKVRVNWQ